MFRSALRSLLGRRVATPSANPIFTKDAPGFARYAIGDYTYGVPRVLEWGEEVGRLRIGKFCSISAEVTIFLGGEHRTDWTSTYPFPQMLGLAHRDSGRWTRGDVVIGHDVWIGLGATIRSGVRIGDGAVIGAHALITSNVEPYSIVVGNPARPVRKRFPDAVIRDLLDLRWWDWPVERIKAAVPYLMSNNVAGLMAAGTSGGTYVHR